VSKRHQILDYVETPIGVIYLRRRALLGRPDTVVTEVTIGHEMLMSSLNTDSERALATEALAFHPGPGPLRVLVGGLGLGYTAHAALADERVGDVRVAERMPAVIAWLKNDLIPLSSELGADPRLEVAEADVYADLLSPATGQGYDLILIDVDHTPTERLDPASEPFYTVEGQRCVATHLAPGGVLAVWSAGDDEEFAAVLAKAYPEAKRAHVTWVNELIDDGQEVTDVIFLARNLTP
jgi:spermidine synthase